VHFLDNAARKRHIYHLSLPCLFRPDGKIKQSKHVLVEFCRRFLSQEGNVLRHLSSLGYTVSHSQTPLDEMELQVQNLSADLRDGVRLVRLLEYLCKSKGADLHLAEMLRVPAVSRLQKVHNVEIAMTFLQDKCGIQLESIEQSYVIDSAKNKTKILAKDIVDGHREKTLAMLWKVSMKHFILC